MFGLHLVFFNYVDFETSPFYITFRRVYFMMAATHNFIISMRKMQNKSIIL